MENKLEELIVKGQTFNYGNNSQMNTWGDFSKASVELLAWIANVEDFLKNNYGEDSSPYKLFNTYDKNQLSGDYQSSLERQIAIINAALIACRQIQPKQKTKQKDDNQILNLLRNPFYWGSLVVLISASFSLGLMFGSAKFDKEKADCYKENTKLSETEKNNKKEIAIKDSLIQDLYKKIKNIKDENNIVK